MLLEQATCLPADAPAAAVNANWLAMKAAISLPAPFKRQGTVISTAPAAAPAPARGPEARGAFSPSEPRQSWLDTVTVERLRGCGDFELFRDVDILQLLCRVEAVCSLYRWHPLRRTLSRAYADSKPFSCRCAGSRQGVTNVVALDCEMVGVGPGGERSALAR